MTGEYLQPLVRGLDLPLAAISMAAYVQECESLWTARECKGEDVSTLDNTQGRRTRSRRIEVGGGNFREVILGGMYAR